MRLALLFLATAAAAFPQVPYERILHAEREPGNWLTYSGSYQSHHYSQLSQINRTNIQRLKPAWIYQARGREHFETMPLVFDGVMYITDPPSDVTALDLRTGRPIWHYRRTIPEGIAVCCGQVNRGVAALDDQLFVATIDGHLVALDAKTGRVRWDVLVGDHKQALTLTAAPLAIKDKIIVGMGGAEYGVRGFLDAYDAKTGQRAWRFWAAPGPGEPGNETWAGESWKQGGASTWTTGSFDPELNLIYWGTGNPGPGYDGSVRVGDNLYSDSVIALDASTGKLKWHYQFVPHDVNDMDATQIPVLVDALWKGVPRKLMLFGNRNAFYYVLDRVTGEYLHSKQFARQNWAERIDDKGRPVPTHKTEANATGVLVYPDDDGTSNWFSPSYSPRTKLFYQNVREKGGYYFKANTTFQSGRMYLGATKRDIPNEEPYGALRALNALTGEKAWEFRMQSPPWSGVLATAGDLVFSGTMEGDFFALDAWTGKVLWRFQTGGEIWANPISYRSEGKQYVAIAAGNAMMIFGID